MKILCSVEGPIFLTGMQTRKNQDLSTLQLEVNIKTPSYVLNNPLINKYLSEKKRYENHIENLFKNVILIERYGRNKIVINIEVMEINCDLIPYAVMGITLALNEANIEQKGICTASNIIRKNGELVLDPTLEEEDNCDFKLIWGCLLDLEENTIHVQKGTIEDENLKDVIFGFSYLYLYFFSYF